MALREKIDAELKDAMRARDQLRMDTIRNIKSAIMYRENEGGEAKLDEPAIMKVISGLVKQRRDSIEQFKAGNRLDLAEKEERELAVLLGFLPQQLTPAELETIVVDAIKESGAVDMKQMGAAIKLAGAKAAGRAEGKAIAELVKKKLSGG